MISKFWQKTLFVALIATTGLGATPARADGTQPWSPTLDGSESSLVAHTVASRLAAEAIRLVQALRPYASYPNFGSYLLPIKKAAGNAFAIAEARGDSAWQTRQALLTVKASIDYASLYLDFLEKQEAAFELCVELRQVASRIDRLVH